MGELKASTLFHIIDARTSYNLLLGRPWLHENGVVPSTLHQCFKYIKNGQIIKVDADMKPFIEAELYFADAKLYLDPDNMQEVLPSRFPIGYSSKEVHPKATPIENNNEKLRETTKDEALTNGKHKVKKPPYSLVFRYVVRSNNKEKKNQPKDHVPLPFKERKQLQDAKVNDLQEIKAELVTPITGGASEDTSSNTRRRQRGSVFDRLSEGHAQQFRKKDRYDEINEHKKNDISGTLHLSRPQGSKTSLLIVSSGGPIKVKQHVVGKPHDSSETLNEEEIEIIIGSNHVSIDEGSDSDVSEDEIQNAPPELEDGVQTTVDELKELNLGTTEEPRLIFISALLSPEEEE
ncbi:UNVERIFIED_CONTAM: hypothetical protein Sradi_6864900 [Sesamum radiatum]|uniref:Uncharacterized protein n=1 Tax=Sesamum radiatum TaxID=300843 RepID=A0AAW2JLC0_SESRA